MSIIAETERARNALWAISPDISREEWVNAGMGFHAAGGDFETFEDWSSRGGSYDAADAKSTWRSFKPGKGVGAGTLFHIAKEHGWTERSDSERPSPRPTPPPPRKKPPEPPRKPAKGMSAAEVWARCEPATAAHAYIVAKQAQGVPLGGLRVVPEGDPLVIMGASMVGALVVPVLHQGETLTSLQFITPPETAARLKAKGKPNKLNLPNASRDGWFTVGDVVAGGRVYVCEGIGTAWACWQATGRASVVCFGWENVRKVAAGLLQKDPEARLVLVPDAGKEGDAAKTAQTVGAAVACMPSGEVSNFDAWDLAQRDGFDVLEALLEAAAEPPKPEPRYKLLSAADLRDLPPLAWRVRGVLPAVGLAALYGPSASGKSFLAFDMAAAIAEGSNWFGHRVTAAPVVYCALEGEAGFKLRAKAWEVSRGRALPDALHMMLQPFKLTEPQDVADLASVVPSGAVVVLDTLNRAAPTADENSSKDMGEILEAAKRLQGVTNGLVLLVHHTGKDSTKGLRGHSSLFAAMDAAVEVSRDGDRREWKVAKTKDGEDGATHPFRLHIETLGVEATGEAVTSCVVARDTAAQDVRDVKLPQGGNQKLVLDALRPMFKAGATGKPGAPPLRPCIELEAAVAAGAGKLTCPTDKRTSRTREAITGLVSRGVLGLNDGWLWQQ